MSARDDDVELWKSNHFTGSYEDVHEFAGLVREGLAEQYDKMAQDAREQRGEYANENPFVCGAIAGAYGVAAHFARTGEVWPSGSIPDQPGDR